MPQPIAAQLRHYAPVWFPAKGNRPDRLALDPLDVPVTVRGVDPGSLRPRAVPVAAGKDSFRYVFEGRLWRALSRQDDAGRWVDDLATGLEVLSGRVQPSAGPLMPMVPETNRDTDFAGLVPIPPRRAGKATLALHQVATETARARAAGDLVHDGERVYAAVGMPLLHLRKGAVAFHDWETSTRTWEPTFRHDQMDLAVEHFAAGGWAPEHVEENRASKRAIVTALGEALHDVTPADDHVRHLLRTAPFVALETYRRFAMPESFADPTGTRRALMELAARGAIGAPVPDPEASVRLLAHVGGRLRLGGGPGETVMRDRMTALHRYCTVVALPALAARAPDEDMAALGGLAP